MPVDWPNAATAADLPVVTSRPGVGRNRLSTVCADFFLDDANRLTDEERAIMGAMLRQLSDDIADELITRLPGLVSAQAEMGRHELYRCLRQSGLIDRPSIVELLLRRTDEQQIGRRSHGASDELLATMITDGDGAVAEAAMALTIARGRRRDRYGRMGIEFDDLAAEDAVVVVNAVAVCIGQSIGRDHDQALAEAARKIIARHDEGRRLEAAVATLARALDGAGRLNDQMIERISEAHDANLLVASLSRRAGITAADGWSMFTGGDAMLLARVAGCQRQTAATIIASFDPMLGTGSPEKAIDGFDRIDEAAADQARRWLRLDPDYRAAQEAVEARDG